MFTRESLHQSLSNLGITDPGDIFDHLHVAYTSEGRFYHSNKHISECLRYLEEYSHLGTKLDEIAVAIWFHDAIYDTHRNDNEELSAAWAKGYLSHEGVEHESIRRIESMIICTKTHEADTEDASLMLDIDLGILGTPRDVFESYDKEIRQEYHWVAEADYRQGRAVVLDSFLERKAIYTTPAFFEVCEKQARENLEWKINELST